MIITKSNILLGQSPTVVTGASTDLPGNITDPDFSTVYVSSDQFRLTFDFGVQPTIDYIAVAGINIAEGNREDENQLSRVRVFEGNTLIKTNQVIRDNCVLINFPSRTFTNLRIGLRNFSGANNPIITFCAAGESFVVPNGGETSGYNRQFLNRSFKQKTTTNSIAAPVAVLRERTPAKGTLNLPNMTASFTENEWQDFLDFSQDNHFFIQEQQLIPATEFSGINQSAYLCYNVGKNTVKAHSQTRNLNNASISFNVYNGL